ncbi:MAG: ubiquinol-cytochrome C chaperone [Rhizobiales bacterium]|nr:ubiquinol-cytochrome C chaperone [Hyphomicrobiales bacterium]MBN9011211.1 ubiquinol-cytochrome C chaperone [Hyphomicrobiales bacterium]
MLTQFLKRNRRNEDIASALYGAIVAQARDPALYGDRGVPDTLEGRFEMIILHLALVLRHLRADEGEKAVGQALFDTFCTEMDRALREMGVGDLGVGKRMRKMAEAFYGRAGRYDAGLETGDAEAIAATIGRALYDEASDPRAGALAAYAAAVDHALSRTAPAALLAADIAWPDPAMAVRAGTPA